MTKASQKQVSHAEYVVPYAQLGVGNMVRAAFKKQNGKEAGNVDLVSDIATVR
jgi:hypothetical protein